MPDLRRREALALLLLLAGCARIEAPPGGPPDKDPPTLLATTPESLAVYPGFDDQVEFIFSEVISEGSQPSMGMGTSDLEKQIILSPSDNVPRVHWRRSVIGVEPKEGWKPDRVYRVQLLPGVMDLQRNRLDSGTVVTFSTGAPLPTAWLSGLVVDWPTGRLARVALIDAVLLPDSLHYKTTTDSSGFYDFGPLPKGEYVVYGVIDQARNFRRDLRDSYDTVRVRADSVHQVATLWAFPHDTVGPRLQNAAVVDSQAVDLTFNQPLDPAQVLDTSLVHVLLLPDSTALPVVSVRSRAQDDSVQRALQRAADTVRADTARRVTLDSVRRAAEERLKPGLAEGDTNQAVLASRPALFDHLVIRLPTPLQPGKQYVILARAIRNVNRAQADSRQLLSVPERPPAAPADSVATSDSLGQPPPDSLKPDSQPAPPRPQ